MTHGFYRPGGVGGVGDVVCALCDARGYTHAPDCPVPTLDAHVRELTAQLGLLVATMKSIEFGVACNEVYAESGAPVDPGMISVHSQRVAYDYYVLGLPWDACLEKHIDEFRAVYGLPPVGTG